jgi:hypothetical protein
MVASFGRTCRTPVPDILNTTTRRGIGSNGHETEELYVRVHTQSGAGKYAAGYQARGRVQEMRDRQLDVAPLSEKSFRPMLLAFSMINAIPSRKLILRAMSQVNRPTI